MNHLGEETRIQQMKDCVFDTTYILIDIHPVIGFVLRERFTVIFWNDDKETITNKEYGTFSQGETKNIDIPAGATQYYMGTYMYGSWFVSPTYKLAGYQTLSLTSDMVNSWTTISTSSAPAHITDLQPAE